MIRNCDATGDEGSSAFDPSILQIGQRLQAAARKALALLVQARHYAETMSVSEWDYALDIRTVTRHGLTQNDLRWMVYNHFLERSDETTLPGQFHRSFVPGGTARFNRSSCFVLTDAGVRFAQLMLKSHSLTLDTATIPARILPPASAALPKIPNWDRERLELRVGEMVVKRFKAPAPNQELILAAFQEEGWPVHIDDPLPPHPEQDPRRRLHDTINSLNRNQKANLVRFLGDGKGQGVRWEMQDHPAVAKSPLPHVSPTSDDSPESDSPQLHQSSYIPSLSRA